MPNSAPNQPQAHTSPITFWNRATQQLETEKVYGEGAIQWMYKNPIGKFLSEAILTRRLVSKMYGKVQSSAPSKSKIKPFIKDFNIKMEEYEDTSYPDFNSFFIRKFKQGARPFTQTQNHLAAFAEARYLAYPQIDAGLTYPVKGQWMSAAAILGNSHWVSTFAEGPMAIARLCPVDYHRFHFPDGGTWLDHYKMHGKLHSVNPVALHEKGDILATNERQVSILQTDHFGKIAYVEVGAMCVGKIVQSVLPVKGRRFERGDEKGYFLFGGSTVIVFGEKGRFTWDEDLLKNTAEKREVWIKLGDSVAKTS